MAKAVKKEKEVSLETVLWNCRVALRGVGSTEKNRDAVIGLVFLKFAGDKFEKRRQEIIDQYGEIPTFLEKVSFYNAVNVFYLKVTARWYRKKCICQRYCCNSRSGYGGYRGKQPSA